MTNGTFISLSEAKALIDRFKQNDSLVVNSPYGFRYDLPMVEKLLSNQANASGIRVYIGMTEANETTTVIVAVDDQGNNLVAGETPCLDMGVPCPTDCGENVL